MKKVDKEAQIRATFEDTKKNQKKWRNKIDELISENRCATKKERTTLFDLFADATFGLGTEPVSFWFSDGNKIMIPNLEYFLRCLIYYDKGNIVSGDFLYSKLGNYMELEVPIGELWENVRDHCGGFTAGALTMSIRISKEREIRDSSIGASLDEI